MSDLIRATGGVHRQLIADGGWIGFLPRAESRGFTGATSGSEQAAAVPAIPEQQTVRRDAREEPDIPLM